MIRLFIAGLICAFFAIASADEISTTKIYIGKELSFCGKVESVSRSSSINSSDDGKSPDFCTLRFTVKRPTAIFHLEFNVKKDQENASLLKAGAILRAKGICQEHNVSHSEVKDGGEPRQDIHLGVAEASVEAFDSGEPEGFVCNDSEANEASDAKDHAPPAKSARKNAPSGDGPAAKTVMSANQQKKSKGTAAEPPFSEAGVMKAIVTVEGGNGKASAFIANVKGKKFLITNIHVIFDNDPKFLTVSNENVEVMSPLLAKDRDLAFYEIKDADKFSALDVDGDIVLLPPDEPVIVLGNSMGSGVNTRLKGKVKGVGPTTLEISAEIVPGNSGSPIIDANSGKVIGVSTYGTNKMKIGFLTKGTRFEEVRRFGTRIDSLDLDGLEPFDAKKYLADVKLYKDISALNELGSTLLLDIYSQKDGKFNPSINPAKYDFTKHASLERIVNEWNDIMRGVEVPEAIPSVLKRLKDQISVPAEKRKQTPYYSWVRGTVAKQLETNDYYCKTIDDLRKEIESYLRK